MWRIRKNQASDPALSGQSILESKERLGADGLIMQIRRGRRSRQKDCHGGVFHVVFS